MKMTGTAHKYGDNVDTDVIIPARHCHIQVNEYWAQHCMEDIDPEFAKRVKPGDFIVGMENFGLGSSREQAPRAIRATKVAGVIACSFARIFFRNCINLGLPVLVCPEAAMATSMGDQLQVDLESGEITNLTKSKTFKAAAYPDFLMEIIAAGGLVPYTKNKYFSAEAKQPSC